MLKTGHMNYFHRGDHETPKFLSRLGDPDFTDKVILDIGCGHGHLCLEAARRGAKRVIGLDLDEERIDFARENLSVNHPQFKNTVEFHHKHLKDMAIHEVDAILSKETFEHVLDLPSLLADITKHLTKGGRLYAGFGRLYYAFKGDHNVWNHPFPWAPALFSEAYLVKRLNARQPGRNVRSVHDLGLNGLSLDQYEHIFHESGLLVIFFQVNCSERAISKVFRLIAKIRPLREYFSHNIYCILEKA